MFLDCLDMIFEVFSGVINAFDVELFSLGGTSVSFWELLLSLLTVSIIFGFFLAPRYGSGISAVGKLLSFKSSEHTYENYAAKRARYEDFSKRYFKERKKK